jgi:hypothetical protein
VLKWASQAGRAYVAPEEAQLREPAKAAARAFVLCHDELAAILPVLRRSPRGHAMQFMLLTLALREEACAARWRDLSESGLDAGDIERVIYIGDGDELERALDQSTGIARQTGVFGSPSFVVGSEIFWGDDQLDDAISWAVTGKLRPR